MGSRIVNRIVDAYFTAASLIVHAIAYPAVMAWEGGDFHLFLDAISIEAVFIALLVGISTKRNREGHRALAHLIERLHKKETHMAIMPTPDPTIGVATPMGASNPAVVVAGSGEDLAAVAQAKADALKKQAADAQALADQVAAEKAAAEKAVKPTVEEQIVGDAVAIVNTVEGAVSNPKTAIAAIIAIATPVAGMVASLGFITSTTSQAIVSATTVLVPAFAGLVAAIISHGRANVKAATIRAGSQS